MAKTAFELSIEQATGRSIEYLRDTPIDEQRRDIEKQIGRPLNFTSSTHNYISHAEAEAAFIGAVRNV
jgi:hypothetical protein